MKRLAVLVTLVLALFAASASVAVAEPFYCDGIAPNAVVELFTTSDAAACGAINQGWIRITTCWHYWDDSSGWRFAAVWMYVPTGEQRVMECVG